MPPAAGVVFYRVLRGAAPWRSALVVHPRFRLDMPKLLSIVPAQHGAATTQTPRRPRGAGGAMVLLDWPPDHLGIGRKIAAIPKHPAENLTPGPSCASHRRSRNANSLCGRDSLDHRKSVRPFKGIFCANISEFESYSQASWVSVACGLGYVGRAGHRGAAIASDGPGAARRVLEYTRHLNKLRTE